MFFFQEERDGWDDFATSTTDNHEPSNVATSKSNQDDFFGSSMTGTNAQVLNGFLLNIG